MPGEVRGPLLPEEVAQGGKWLRGSAPERPHRGGGDACWKGEFGWESMKNKEKQRKSKEKTIENRLERLKV